MEYAAAVGELMNSFGAGVVFALLLIALLGRIWEVRISEALRSANSQASEALTQKRAGYQALAKSFRHEMPSYATSVDPDAFPLAYDQAALFASEQVMQALGDFVELGIKHARNNASVTVAEFEAAIGRCMEAMRKDSGFPKSRHRHRAIWKGDPR